MLQSVIEDAQIRRWRGVLSSSRGFHGKIADEEYPHDEQFCQRNKFRYEIALKPYHFDVSVDSDE